MSPRLKIGDLVRIRKESEYSHQKQGVGRIKEIDTNMKDYMYHVVWPDKYSNNYREKDLVIAQKPKPVRFIQTFIRDGEPMCETYPTKVSIPKKERSRTFRVVAEIQFASREDQAPF